MFVSSAEYYGPGTNYSERQKKAIARSLDDLERKSDQLEGNPTTMAHVACGCALGYLDFRFPSDNWRDGRPKLSKWYEEFSKRESMQGTVPQDPV